MSPTRLSSPRVCPDFDPPPAGVGGLWYRPRRNDREGTRMDSGIEQRLRATPQERLQGMRRGVEKESLRALPDGELALTPHPAALGSALTHPNITTDFSESQLEFVTSVPASAQAVLDELTQIHQFTYRVLQEGRDEMLWVS